MRTKGVNVDVFSHLFILLYVMPYEEKREQCVKYAQDSDSIACNIILRKQSKFRQRTG